MLLSLCSLVASPAELLRLQQLYQELQLRGLTNPEVTATAILKGLGFSAEMIQQSAESLSGGWRMR